MAEEYQIVSKEKPEWGVIGGGIHNYNIEQVGDAGEHSICYVLQGADQEVVGGVIGATHMGWLYINLMWIKGEL
ncbi:hypothetical protein ACFLXI_06780 [Chloroflexota bacterium]